MWNQIVSSLAVDSAGARVLSGSYDYTVRMYDFQGMNSRLQSFRQIEPSEGHQVRSLSWSPTSGQFLCVTGSAQAKVCFMALVDSCSTFLYPSMNCSRSFVLFESQIYDRDGLTLGEFMKGDMYIRDLKNTKGHICGLTCGEWHPRTKETVLTSSEDGSLRIWDVNNFLSQTQVRFCLSIIRTNEKLWFEYSMQVASFNCFLEQVIKPKLARPGRVPVTTCAWDRDGKRIAGGIGDGSIQVMIILSLFHVQRLARIY